MGGGPTAHRAAAWVPNRLHVLLELNGFCDGRLLCCPEAAKSLLNWQWQQEGE